MAERYILWHDWHWVHKRIELIGRDKRETRRWDLMSRLAAAAGGFNGGEAMNFWQDLIDATITEAERQEQVEQEERRIQAELAEQRRERQEQMKARKRRLTSM